MKRQKGRALKEALSAVFSSAPAAAGEMDHAGAVAAPASSYLGFADLIHLIQGTGRMVAEVRGIEVVALSMHSD